MSRIAAVADPVTRNFDVEVEIPNPDRSLEARHDRLGRAGGRRPARPSRRSSRSPPSSREREGKEQFAVLVVDGAGANTRARRREVELGDVVGNRVAVTRGLSGGEQVVTTGAIDGHRR